MPSKFGINNETGDVVMEGTINDFNKEIKIKEEDKLEKFDIERHWDDFIRYKIAVNCPTEKLANEFLKYCKERNINWYGGKSLDDHNNWKSRETCYYCEDKEMTFGHVKLDYAKSSRMIVVEFTGFENTYILVDKPKQNKPPLSVMSKQIFEWHRVIELCRALHEYSLFEDVDQNLMIKWADELNDRLYGLKGDKEFDLLGNL